jgi:hypothetical protein
MRKWFFRVIPIFLVILGVYLFSPSTVKAADCVWKDNTTGAWSDKNNWTACGTGSNSTYPKTVDDTATIN